ncbi:MAG: efflux RND transporter periplasmic adaptor subunit, partial [Polyangia bacterium]
MNHTRVIPVTTLCLTTVFAVGCPRRAANSSIVPPNTEVWLAPEQVAAAKLVVEPLEPQPVGGVVVASGRVTFDDLHVAHVLSPVTGRVVKIEAQPGQRVKKGDALAVIESPDVATAFSDLAKAQADFGAAEKEANRQKDLFDVHAGSQRDLESAQSNFSKARAELDR